MRVALGPPAVVLGLLLSATTARADLPTKLVTERLDNGLELVLAPMPGSGLVAYWSVVRVGSRDETEPGVTGFAHFFEHMMFRGTEAWPPSRVEAFLKTAGADQNGFTTDDFTCYTFFGLASALETLVEMEADRFRNLKYDEDTFRTEAKAVLGEYNKSASSPYLPLRERQRELVFTKHTYGHTTLGKLADIRDMPNQYAYSKQFFSRFYTPDNVVIVAAGDFDPVELRRLIRKHYGPWTGKKADAPIVAEPEPSRALEAHVAWPTGTEPLLSLSWRTPRADFEGKDTAVETLLFELLFGDTSPLYRSLVLERPRVRRFVDYNWWHRDPYLFHAIAVLTEPSKAAEVQAEVQRQIDKLRAGEIDEAQLEAVKSHVRYAALLDLSSPDRVVQAIASTLGAGGDAEAFETLLATIAEVTVDDVERYARLYLGRERRSVVTLWTGEKKGPAPSKETK
jgi:zinc protease